MHWFLSPYHTDAKQDTSTWWTGDVIMLSQCITHYWYSKLILWDVFVKVSLHYAALQTSHSLSYMNTKLPSDLRPTACECVHLVTHVHFRSRHKDGGYTIRSALPENTMLHTNFTVLCLIQQSYCQLRVYIVGWGIFDLFGSCDLNLMIFI